MSHRLAPTLVSNTMIFELASWLRRGVRKKWPRDQHVPGRKERGPVCGQLGRSTSPSTKSVDWNGSPVSLPAYCGIPPVFCPSVAALRLSAYSVSNTPRAVTHLPITRGRAKIQPRLGDLQRRLFPRWWLCGLALRAGEPNLWSLRTTCSPT